jgi:hypothetical protein
MFLIGLLLMLVPAGASGWLAYENRAAVVHVQVVGDVVWTGHLYEVFVMGALLACWFILGAAFVQCRLGERRRIRRTAAAPVPQQPRKPVRQPRRTAASAG